MNRILLFSFSFFISFQVYSQTQLEGRIQVTSNVPPTSGSGLEIGYNVSSGFGFITSYDRDYGIYKSMAIDGSVVYLRSGTDAMLQVDGNGASAITKRFRVMGNNGPTTGKGLEFGYNGSGNGAGHIVTYDRDNGRFQTMTIDGSEVFLRSEGTAMLQVDGNGASSISKRFRVMSNISPTTGNGLEFGYNSSNKTGYITSYDRDNSSYQSMAIDGSIVYLRSGTSAMLQIDENGASSISKRFRVMSNISPTTGNGLEFGYNSSNKTGYITSYDRDNSSYQSMAIDGSVVYLRSGTSTMLQIDENGASSMSKRFRVEGNVVPSTGRGLEFGYNNSRGNGYISSYDRDNDKYQKVLIDGSFISLFSEASEKLRVGPNGVEIFGDLTVGGETVSAGSDSPWTLGENGINYALGKVSIGSISPPGDFAFAVDGKAIMEEVKVQLSENWPDYVFESDYKLKSLEEVEAHIKGNGHLPEIPSEAEVATEDGISLGEMNIKLLQKVEELTLYLIEEHKQNQEHQTRISQLEKRIADLESK